MSVLFKLQRPEVAANLTPLIDVTFLLIIFFVLVSQIVEVENVDMDLPAPRDPASELAGEELRVVINVLPGAGGRATGYRLRGRTYPAGTEGVQRLAAGLAALYRDNPALTVNLRADRSTHYLGVEPVLQAVSAAARLSGHPNVSGRVNLVVTREP